MILVEIFIQKNNTRAYLDDFKHKVVQIEIDRANIHMQYKFE